MKIDSNGKKIYLPEILKESGLAHSLAEAKRFIFMERVRINKALVNTPNTSFTAPYAAIFCVQDKCKIIEIV